MVHKHFLKLINFTFRAVRYCGTVFGYTSIAILLNYSESSPK